MSVFAENSPSLSDRARGRRRQFDDVECVLPSRVVRTESLTATALVWDEYTRLLPEYDGPFTVVQNNADWYVVDGTDDESAAIDAFTATGERRDDEPVLGMTWDEDRGSGADVYYLRVEQADDGMACTGPLWVEAE